METNLRKLLVEESVPLPMEVEIEEGRITQTIPTIVYQSKPGQWLLWVSEDGESVLSSNCTRRFFPPLMNLDGSGIDERIVALFESAAIHKRPQPPLVEPSKLEGYFREMLPLERGESPRLLIRKGDDLGELGWAQDVFVGATPGRVLGIKGKPGAIIETPVGLGLFLHDINAVVQARVY